VIRQIVPRGEWQYTSPRANPCPPGDGRQRISSTSGGTFAKSRIGELPGPLEWISPLFCVT
jgi:hypothetical protein